VTHIAASPYKVTHTNKLTSRLPQDRLPVQDQGWIESGCKFGDARKGLVERRSKTTELWTGNRLLAHCRPIGLSQPQVDPGGGDSGGLRTNHQALGFVDGRTDVRHK
jgi:hypothetical protein